MRLAVGALPKINLDTGEVDFDRLLLKQKATNVVKLSNVCAVPVKWKLNPPADGIPESFVIDSLEGTLSVGEEKAISFTFQADQPATHKFALKLQIGDTEGLKPLVDTQDIHVAAEAFEVAVVPEFKGEGRGLDFGDPRCRCIFI